MGLREKKTVNVYIIFEYIYIYIHINIYIYILIKKKQTVQIIDTFIEIAKNGSVDLYLLKWRDAQDGFLSEK